MNTDDQIEVATRADEKEQQKTTDKYQDLAMKLTRLWKVKTKMIPIVVGALGKERKGSGLV